MVLSCVVVKTQQINRVITQCSHHPWQRTAEKHTACCCVVESWVQHLLPFVPYSSSRAEILRYHTPCSDWRQSRSRAVLIIELFFENLWNSELTITFSIISKKCFFSLFVQFRRNIPNKPEENLADQYSPYKTP